MMPEDDVRLHLQREYFYRNLQRPNTVEELETLIEDVINCSPGDQHDSVMIRRDGDNFELGKAGDFINACHHLVVSLCRQISSLPAPPNLDGARRQGTISALTEILAWCRRASMMQAKKKPGRPGRPAPSDATKKMDAAIAKARAAGHFPRNADLAREFGVTEQEVRMALDRHRKRESRARNSTGR